VNFEIYKGETFALVGESGSGKTTIGRAIVRINPITSGEVLFKGERVSGKISKEMDTKVIRSMQMIFQDPMASLNPRKKVEDIIGEGLDIHKRYTSRQDRADQISEMLKKVGLSPEHAARYPHQFSGGQRQRVGIARALIMQPRLIIADECISALDVSIQAQVVNLMKDIQEETGCAYLFIAHDLSMVKYISDRIAVMYLGHMMEIADADELNNNPMHPYTLSLLSAVPIPDPETARKSKRIVLEGDVPSPLHMPSGCPFRTRCKYATEQCAMEMPQLKDRGNGHFVACHNK
jgi:oligopeptide transport system ATP-binding protein